MLARDAGKVDKLKHAMHEQFAWTPPGVLLTALYLLEHGRREAAGLPGELFSGPSPETALFPGMIAEYQEALFSTGRGSIGGCSGKRA